MLRFFSSPLVRISFGLVMVTISALLLSDMLGMVPDTRHAELNARKVIAESLAVQFSTIVGDDQLDSMKKTLKFLVERNENLLSAGLRREHGDLLVEFGGHSQYWTLKPGEDSTPTQIQLRLFDNESPWGTVELSFTDLALNKGMFIWKNSFLAVVVLVALAGFFGYLLFLKRTMRELDPSAVIPERVRQALDTLSEGLLIVDQDNYMVFSNAAFARKTGFTADALVGRKSDSLPWEADEEDSNYVQLPWNIVLQGGELPAHDIVTVKLSSGLDKIFKFKLSASPILSDTDEIRGALITFDDITEVEKQNEELQRALGKLERSQVEISQQNRELNVLATRDPLTGLLNRRSFFESFDILIAEAIKALEPLACIMVDIDHFKLVNDNFGHSTGDTVIKLLATVLNDFTRPNDIVGRFGGEEFCVALPGANREAAFAIAERMRRAVQNTKVAEFENKHSIAISSGITDLAQGAKSVAELVDQADKALYFAKENGRNRVILWPMDAEAESAAALSKVQEADILQEMEMVDPPEVLPVPADAQYLETADEVVEQKKSHDELSQSDPLPSRQSLLPVVNRTLLIDRINQSIYRSERQDTMIAVLSIEFDVLQRVNETLGFSIGQKLENAVTHRLKEALRTTDTVSGNGEVDPPFSFPPTGGREIVLLLTDLQDTDIVPVILQRIFSATEEPVQVEGDEFYLDADVGVSVYPVDSEDGDSLLSHANSAMREAKKSVGNNNWQFYSEEVNSYLKRQIQLEADLHLALQRGELIAYYQPKVCIKTGTILSMEALLRWRHPQLGMVPPDEFIALAERSDLIDKITNRVITTVCRQIKAWQDSGYGLMPVAVNLSPVQFRNTKLADQILSLVNNEDIPLESLEFEITETVVVQNMKTAVDILEKLTRAGIAISIDDFGVGYSSFTYLKKFPVSKVKIDKTFVTDLSLGPAHAAIISAMIAMAHGLGLTVVAEGVETEEELRFLQDLHCDQVQGYLLSRPLPADEISKLLSDYSDIRRMILKYDRATIDTTSRQGGASMFGIINEFSPEVISLSKMVASNSETEKV